MKYKSIKLTEESHKKLKKYCDQNFLKMHDWLSNLVNEYIDNMEKSSAKNKKM